MSQSSKRVERSFEMIIAGYYLSRCGDRTSNRYAGPPSALGVGTSWKKAYKVFYKAMGDGRRSSQFCNSLMNTRDTFDILFPNGRKGWKYRDGRQRSMGNKLKDIHEEWKKRSDGELEAFVLGLLNTSPMPAPADPASQNVRTEGGKRVFISVRYERNPTLRKNALAIHGYNCMACGFNYKEFYGEIGKGFIEVHHVVPLASVFGETEVNPDTDLVVLCANCHGMVHRRKGTCLSVQEIKKHIRR